MQGVYNYDIITVNQLKQELFPFSLITSNEINQIQQENFDNDKFIFSTYMNISSKIILSTNIILLIAEISERPPPNNMKKVCENIITFINTQKKIDNNSRNSPFSLDENPLPQHISNLNFDQITSIFCEYFPQNFNLDILRTFYFQLKKERVMSYFLTIDIIKQYFKSIYENNRENSQKILDNFNELKTEAYEIQNKKIYQIFQFFIQIFHEIYTFREILKDLEITSSQLKDSKLISRNDIGINNFTSQINKKQIEKIKILNYSSSDNEEIFKNNEDLNKKIDTIEQISYKENYKPSHYLDNEEVEKKQKIKEKSDDEIFEEIRQEIKNELNENYDNENFKRFKKKGEAQVIIDVKYQSQYDNYLRNMLKFSTAKSQIERSFNYFLFLININKIYIVDKQLDKKSESILEFQHKLKNQKEKTKFNLYHTGSFFLYNKLNKRT